MNNPEEEFMKVESLIFNDNIVYVLDAPVNATHGRIEYHFGVNYNVCRKNKVMHGFIFDKGIPDEVLESKYKGKLVNVGMLSIANESVVADLFVPKKNGNFYDYEYNGIFYPNALGLLKDVIEQNMGFKNPFVLIVKP